MLQNRFPPKVFEFWIGHYTCLLCGRNTADQLHHIISPTSHNYIKGKHNISILNSAHLCRDCHINQPLQNNKMQKLLLNKTLIITRNYAFEENDKQFFKIYQEVYK